MPSDVRKPARAAQRRAGTAAAAAICSSSSGCGTCTAANKGAPPRARPASGARPASDEEEPRTARARGPGARPFVRGARLREELCARGAPEATRAVSAYARETYAFLHCLRPAQAH